MAFDFPASPANGQRFTPAGGPTYVFGSGVWKIEGSIGAPGNLSMSDTPPASPQPGQMWWESDSGNLFAWFNDGDSQQWVQVNVPNVSGLAASQARNRIVNGAMQISQETAKGTSLTTNGAYVADQWAGLYAVTAGAPAFGTFAPNFIRLNSSAANASPGAGDYYMLAQFIEGIRVADFQWGSATALPVVLRFDAKSNFAGTFGVSIRNGTVNDRSYVKNLNILGDNVYRTFTVAIPGDTTGTWNVDNSRAAAVYFAVVAGANNIGVEGWQSGGKIVSPGISNWMGASGRTFDVTNVGLYLDPTNSGIPPRWELPDEAQELAACMRYYVKFTSLVIDTSATSQSTAFPVPMRTAPAYSGGGAGFTLGGQSGNTAGAPYVNFWAFQTTRANVTSFVANARM